MDAFNEINANVWKNIKSKTFDRNAIEKPLLDKIKQLKNEIEQLRNSAKCKHCGIPHDLTMLNCAECGELL